jgi:urease accessory protein
MIRALSVTRDGDTADTITLDHDARHRRRLRLVTDGGLEFLLDLPQATPLRDGDRLLLEDGRAVLVRAAAERVVDVAGAPSVLLRIAWHLGNRHCPTQLLPDGLRIRDDHVLVELVRGLGGGTVSREAPFDPEAGAYAQGHHRHDHHGP